MAMFRYLRLRFDEGPSYPTTKRGEKSPPREKYSEFREGYIVRFEYEYIVIGGGIGGLGGAALLARQGADLLLLESHSMTGGCASCFDRYDRSEGESPRRFRFDVGATTLSGVAPGAPLRRLFDRLGGEPPMRRIDPGMVCRLRDGTTIVRHGESERWIAECERCFGKAGQREFWLEVYRTEARAWRLSVGNRTFPPKSIGDLLGLIRPANLAALPLLRYTWTSVLEIMRRHGLDQNRRFVEFIDEQLMITAQSTSVEAPFLVGAMGLAYPSETWYADGGAYALARFLEEKIEQYGGEVRTKRRATAIFRQGGEWVVETSRGEIYRCRRLIANLTRSNLARLVRGEAETESVGDDAPSGWGAFMLYCAVRDTFDDRGTLYHQIHCEPLPYCGSRSIFVSLSHEEDRARAPLGWRTVTVSTHVADPWRWESLEKDEYEGQKCELERMMLELMGRALPGFAEAERKFVLTGSPRTFLHYTGRLHGMVGGIPHSIRRNMLFAPNYRTPFDNLYLVGDTVYPGQGMPAVVLGALNLVDSLS